MLHGLDRKRIQALHPPPLSALEIDVADGVRAPTAEARSLGKLVRYVRARVGPGEPVFVANPRYDLVKVGNPLVYVLLDRPNPTRYDVMQPGVVTTAEVQREIVADLERAGPGSWSAGSRRWPRRRSQTARGARAGCRSSTAIWPAATARIAASGTTPCCAADRATERSAMTDAHRRDMPRACEIRAPGTAAWIRRLRWIPPSSISWRGTPDAVCSISARVWAATATRSASAWSHALDINEEYVEAAGIGVRADRYDGERLPLADGAVDTVIMVEVLEHLDAPGDLLDEAARVAGRNVLVTTPNCTQRFPAATIEFSHMLDVDHRRFFTESSARGPGGPVRALRGRAEPPARRVDRRTGAPASADEHVRAPARRRRSAAVLLAAAGAGLGGPRGRRVTRVLVVSGEPVGGEMAGPAIRALELARVLAEHCRVTLAARP